MGLQLKVGGTEADIISEFQVFQLAVWFVMAQSSQLFNKGCITFSTSAVPNPQAADQYQSVGHLVLDHT